MMSIMIPHSYEGGKRRRTQSCYGHFESGYGGTDGMRKIDKNFSRCYYTSMRKRRLEEVKTMLCHLLIDLSKKLCTGSDDRTKPVQR